MKRITLLLAAVALPSLASDQSLADAARKAREGREKNAKEGVKTKVYTQDDVKKAPPLANDPNKPSASSGSRTTPAAAGSSAESTSPGATVGGQSEAAWRGRVAEAHRRIEAAQKEYELWSGYTMVPGDILVDEKDRPVVTTVEQLQRKTIAAKTAWDAAQRALANLEEEARKAGVPPGWLR